MKFQKIAICVGLGVLLGALMLISPVLFFVSLTILLIIGIIIVSPYIGIILLLSLAPFQPFIRELIGGSIIRFWREVLLLMIFSVALTKAFFGKQKFQFFPKYGKTSPTLWATIIFVCYMVLRSALGPKELQTISGLAEYCLYSLFFVACLLLLTNSKQVLGIFITVSVVAVLMALGGIWESILGGEFIISTHINIDRSTFPRSASFMESPLELGCYLALSFPLILASIHEVRTRFLRFALIIIAIIVIIGLGTTGSRGPWVQFVVSVLVYVSICPGFSFTKRLKATFATVIVLLLIFIFIVLIFPIMGVRLVSITDWEKDPGNIFRINRWTIAFNDISEVPILGKGLGSKSPLRGRKSNIDVNWESITQESFILKIWLEAGIIGLFCFLYLYISATRCVYFPRRIFYVKFTYQKVAIISCFFGLFIEILIHQTLISWSISMMFWCFIAISILLNSDKLRNRNLDIRQFDYLKHSSI